MSYRNDHDAALARIDALEAELGKNRDAKARFTTLEQQLAAAKAERDRMRTALDDKESRRGPVIAMVGLTAMLALGGAAIAIGAMSHASPNHHEVALPAPAPPAPPAPSVAARTAELMACVAELDRAVSNRVASSPSCLGSIKRQADDPTLGDDIHAVLHDWYAAEVTDLATRDRLVDRIHAYVIPSYTR